MHDILGHADKHVVVTGKRSKPPPPSKDLLTR
jgi:hypothetical protein